MYTLMVCPHDTVRSAEGWYRLVQYLTARLGLALHFELAMDFTEFNANLGKADLAYLNPKDCYTLRKERGFTPLLRPAGIYDEALVVAAAGDTGATLASVAGAPLATVKPLLPTKIGLRLLRQGGVTPGELRECDSWLGVVRNVWAGETPYGLLYRDAYDELSEQGKGMVRLLGGSDERAAFHCFSVGPKLAERQAEIATLMLAMAADPEGREVLADLHLPGWVGVTADELAHMAALIEE